MKKTNAEWKGMLSAQLYHVSREKGTEKSFSGKYNYCEDTGVYLCTCCQSRLFHSSAKFDSGSGWPSFDRPDNSGSIYCAEDNSLAAGVRIEVLCASCDAHLGHVFNGGITVTKKRYCINSVVLDLQPEGEK
jgi:peptide-methionine (R)-S-oxide reductase